MADQSPTRESQGTRRRVDPPSPTPRRVPVLPNPFGPPAPPGSPSERFKVDPGKPPSAPRRKRTRDQALGKKRKSKKNKNKKSKKIKNKKSKRRTKIRRTKKYRKQKKLEKKRLTGGAFFKELSAEEQVNVKFLKAFIGSIQWRLAIGIGKDYTWYNNPKPKIIGKYRIFYKKAMDRYESNTASDLIDFITDVRREASNEIKTPLEDDVGTYAPGGEPAKAAEQAVRRFDTVSRALPDITTNIASLKNINIETVEQFIARLKSLNDDIEYVEENGPDSLLRRPPNVDRNISSEL